MEKLKKKSKVAVVGAGNVGSTFAFSLMFSGLVDEIVLIDRNRKKAEGECLDLNHGMSFVSPSRIYAGDYSDTKGADIVVITAGAKQKEGQSRLELVEVNVGIFKDIIPRITRYNKNPIILVVSNPVDILTYVTLKVSGLGARRVFGSGTLLDTSRFKFLISRHCNVDPRNVHAYIIGEHGDTELPVWSKATIGGIHLSRYCPICGRGCNYKAELGKIFGEVKNAAYRIIEAKGATYYAIGLALVRIVEAVVRDENSVLPVSVLIDGYYGIDDVCLSLPCIINSGGVGKVLKIELSPEEENQLKRSSDVLKGIIKKLKI